MAKAKKSSAYLDAVAKARSELVLARATLEHRLRQELEERLSNMQTQLDLAVRYAYDQGHSKGQILSAMGAKYYGIVNDSLARTEGVAEVEGVDPLDGVYSFDGEVLSVRYDKHGPREITGEAQFTYKNFTDGEMFLSLTPPYSEDFSVRNEVVGALDQRMDGFYYEEALEWLHVKLQEDA